MRDFYIAEVEDGIVEQLDRMKAAGFDYKEIFKHAVKVWLEKGPEECAKELAAARVSKLMAGMARKVS